MARYTLTPGVEQNLYSLDKDKGCCSPQDKCSTVTSSVALTTDIYPKPLWIHKSGDFSIRGVTLSHG